MSQQNVLDVFIDGCIDWYIDRYWYIYLLIYLFTDICVQQSVILSGDAWNTYLLIYLYIFIDIFIYGYMHTAIDDTFKRLSGDAWNTGCWRSPSQREHGTQNHVHNNTCVYVYNRYRTILTPFFARDMQDADGAPLNECVVHITTIFFVICVCNNTHLQVMRELYDADGAPHKECMVYRFAWIITYVYTCKISTE